MTGSRRRLRIEDGDILKNGVEGTRINKYLSEAGVCSRREADRLVGAGEVMVDGEVAQPGSRVAYGQRVTVRGRYVNPYNNRIVLAFNKPMGIVCTTTDKQGHNNIVEYIGYPDRIYPVGRLDKDSEGLILMTNDGELMDGILRASNGHEKEYIVRVDKPITEAFIADMAGGVYLEELGRQTLPCVVERVTRFCFRIILTQGLNRQIRRMCDAFGYRVLKLKRIRIMNIELGDLKVGKYRELTEQELAGIDEMLANGRA
jgi:23S rRNA pseudouridine2604 synthase